MTAWLCKRVGTQGHVVAIDLETKFLEELQEPNLEIRQLDIIKDLIETKTLYITEIPLTDSIIVAASVSTGCGDLIVLFVGVGINLPFFSTLFSCFTMSANKKRNHALEHGTIYFLKKRFGKKFRVGGYAKKNGFRICGVSKAHNIIQALDQFAKEFSRKNPELFISLRFCKDYCRIE